jgi:preprotein translocase subunit SecE
MVEVEEGSRSTAVENELVKSTVLVVVVVAVVGAMPACSELTVSEIVV